MIRRVMTLAFCVFAGAASMAQAAELRAGASKVSITPTPDQFPYKIGRENPFVGVHDDVFARALVLESGNTRAVLVVAEVTAVPIASQIVQEVAQAAGVPVSNVIVTASHTHESLSVFIADVQPSQLGRPGNELIPSQQTEIEHIRKGIVDAAVQAVANLKPARIAFGRGEAFVNINNGEQAGLRSWYDDKGPSDKTLAVAKVETTGGEPLALLISYGTHAEVMYRSVVKDGGYLVTGDLPGAVSRTLEGSRNGAPVALYLAGAEADQLSLFKSVQPAAGGLPEADEGAAGYALLNVMSRRLSLSVLNTLEHMKPAVADAPLYVAVTTVTCPGQRTRMDSSTGKVVKQEAPTVSIPLSAIRIGDIGIAAVAGDIASDIGKDIRKASPVPNLILASQMAGAVGYILADASYEKPGHGIGGSHLKEGCASAALSKGIAGLLRKSN